MFLDRGKGPSGRAPGAIAPPRPEPDVARAGDSEQEVVRGCGLGSVAGAGEGGAARYTQGHRGVERQVPEPASSARQGARAESRGRTVRSGKGRNLGHGMLHWEPQRLWSGSPEWTLSGGGEVASGLCQCCWGLWDLGSSRLGLEGVKMGARGREKGEDCNKVFPNGLGFGSGGCRGAKGSCGGSPEAEGWYFIFWEDGVEETDQV